MSKVKWTTRGDGKRVCAECNAPEGCCHTDACSLWTQAERMESYVKTARNAERRWKAAAFKSQEARAAAEGRCAILRHENNKLRRRMERCRAHWDAAYAALVATCPPEVLDAAVAALGERP